MAVSESQLKKMLGKYKYRDLSVQETISVIAQYKDLKPVMDGYVFNDGSSRELMSLTGTIPVSYRGNTYNIPICLWLLDTYPFNPPICFVKPTSTMTIKTGKHVDANGKIYLPYLHEWKHPQSDLIGLIQVMIVVFGDEPPVFSRPTISAGYPPYQATGPPNASYMPGMPSGMSPYPPGPPPNPSGYPYPFPQPSGPFPATTSTQHYPSQPPVTTVADGRRKQKQVWICGHSYVFWAEKRSLERSFAPKLGVRLQDAKLHWLGKSGMTWDQLIPTLLHSRRRLTDPDVLVIHLGGNDLGTDRNMDIINQMKKDLGHLKQIFKNSILVWSNIVPRKVWNQEIHHEVMEKSRRQVNQAIGHFIERIGGIVIRHDTLVPGSPGLFHLNGVLLSESGTDIFILDLLNALETLV
ncbi:tumor susceptibility gene 101 protein isoform X1 [Anolis carolinensis]|uniref:Tumor susceptibility 101 n=2 Tax=Anolis carolinensis TaxID=28377 RepID=A0A803TR58_ANOCA|nr:PREDICTED: tumor susceptibility gene 101 protein isoform X1 [Anolis carolinensis]|eukprot:XP_008105807.1 PREDICTED: tumor susceptibility gene 101 protein isoform X1 [Anolis carolinensis]